MSDNGYKSGSNLEKVLKAGHFAFTGECGPAQRRQCGASQGKMEPLRGMVDAINVTDNQTAVVRMSSWAASLMVQAELEPNFQMVCRDRNRMAMQSDILGAHALGYATCSACPATTRSSATIPNPRMSSISTACSS
jgi:methylenetetrahydrofolate reductase (NADPH)